jgi:hypothetical protein
LTWAMFHLTSPIATMNLDRGAVLRGLIVDRPSGVIRSDCIEQVEVVLCCRPTLVAHLIAFAPHDALQASLHKLYAGQLRNRLPRH